MRLALMEIIEANPKPNIKVAIKKAKVLFFDKSQYPIIKDSQIIIDNRISSTSNFLFI